MYEYERIFTCLPRPVRELLLETPMEKFVQKLVDICNTERSQSSHGPFLQDRVVATLAALKYIATRDKRAMDKLRTLMVHRIHSYRSDLQLVKIMRKVLHWLIHRELDQVENVFTFQKQPNAGASPKDRSAEHGKRTEGQPPCRDETFQFAANAQLASVKCTAANMLFKISLRRRRLAYWTNWKDFIKRKRYAKHLILHILKLACITQVTRCFYHWKNIEECNPGQSDISEESESHSASDYFFDLQEKLKMDSKNELLDRSMDLVDVPKKICAASIPKRRRKARPLNVVVGRKMPWEKEVRYFQST